MFRFLPAVTALGIALAGCRSSPPSTSAGGASDQQARGSATTSPQEEPETTPPADVSHGEATIGGPAAEPAPVLARLAPAERTRLHRIRLEMTHSTVTIAPGVRYAAWTFDGAVPGPVLHVRQGEFMYHCGTAPVAMHIANGMYGALIVDPAEPRPAAKELVLVQSEFWEKLLGQAPDHIVFNGRANQYATHPIDVQPDELLRLYPFVTHAFADASKGGVGVLRALAPGQKPGGPGVAMAH